MKRGINVRTNTTKKVVKMTLSLLLSYLEKKKGIWCLRKSVNDLSISGSGVYKVPVAAICQYSTPPGAPEYFNLNE